METQFHPERWSFADYFAFSRAILSGQLENSYELLKVIVDEKDFNELNAETGARLINRVTVRLGQDAENVKKEDPETKKAPLDAVEVNLSKWSIPQIYEFEKVNRAGNIPELERMMHMVAHIEGVDKALPLPYWEGLLMKSAIMNKHNRVMSGKN
jgi:hypothetical protein